MSSETLLLSRSVSRFAFSSYRQRGCCSARRPAPGKNGLVEPDIVEQCGPVGYVGGGSCLTNRGSASSAPVDFRVAMVHERLVVVITDSYPGFLV